MKDSLEDKKKIVVGVADKNRGTQDEVEVIKLILESHPGLKARVLNKIREIRGTSVESSAPEKLKKGS